eukprot:3432305-Alexandrium_andersonii.AAC.1
MGDGAPQARFRLTSDMDFPRGITGVKSCVDIVGGADTDALPIKKAKAFTDVSLGEAMSKERWNA